MATPVLGDTESKHSVIVPMSLGWVGVGGQEAVSSKEGSSEGPCVAFKEEQDISDGYEAGGQ